MELIILSCLGDDGKRGDSRVWWWIMANSAFELVGMLTAAPNAWWSVCWMWPWFIARFVVPHIFDVRLASWQFMLMFTNHRLVLVHVLPLITNCLLYFTSHFIFKSVTSHPAFHSLTMDSRECAANPGTMCPSLAFTGSCEMSNLQVCVDCTWSPSGIMTWRGLSTTFLFVIGAIVRRKWLVASESNIAHSLILCWFKLIHSTCIHLSIMRYFPWANLTMIFL